MSSKNFQVDGVGINADHFSSFKKEDFVKDILPGMPDRFGNEAQKTVWAENAFGLMQKAFPTAPAASAQVQAPKM
jgi:hypothetical protein